MVSRFGSCRRATFAIGTAGGQRKNGAQHDGRSPKAAAHSNLAPSRKPCHSNYSYFPRGLIPAKQFNLPRPEHFDSRPATRLDPATDPNPSILERLKGDSGRFDRRKRAP
jgi:hypothetical protein